MYKLLFLLGIVSLIFTLFALQDEFYFARKFVGMTTNWMYPNYSECQRCSRVWAICNGHYTHYGKSDASVKSNDPSVVIMSVSAGCFPLCEQCWSELTPEQRLPYYRQLVDLWIEQNVEEQEEYEVKWESIKKSVLEGN